MILPTSFGGILASKMQPGYARALLEILFEKGAS
jgi:hypothetical protein